MGSRRRDAPLMLECHLLLSPRSQRRRDGTRTEGHAWLTPTSPGAERSPFPCLTLAPNAGGLLGKEGDLVWG